MRQRIYHIIILTLFCHLTAAAVSYQQLADSLTAYTGFSSVWSPAVHITAMVVKGNNVTIRTNKVLAGLSLSEPELKQLRRQVSTWVLGHPNGKIRIYSDNYELGELAPYTASVTGRHPSGAGPSLQGRHIALWPSHGMYYNARQDLWRWQRATLWGTVEDMLTQDMVSRWLVPMLRNAGAIVYSPRPLLPEWNALGWEEEPLPAIPQAPFLGARSNLEKDSTIPREVWDTEEGRNDYLDDLRCRPNWANHLSGGSRMNPTQQGAGIPLDLCLAIHTDGYDGANDSDIIGTLAIWYNQNDRHEKRLANGQSRLSNRMLADYIQTQIVNDMRSRVTPRWTRRQLLNASYCEARVPEVPSALIELFSHKNYADMTYCLDQQVQQLVCRAVYKGVARYLNGDDAVILPLPPHGLSVAAKGNKWELRWVETPDSIEHSAQPDYYRIHITRTYATSHGDSVVHDVRHSKNCTHRLTAEPGCRYTFRVTACNKGGESLPSPAVSAAKQLNAPLVHTPQVLVIDAFDRVDGPRWFADSLTAGIAPGSYPVWEGVTWAYLGQTFIYQRAIPWTDDDNCGWGMCYRDQQFLPSVGNTHDYSVRHGKVLSDMGLSYCSMTVDALEHIDRIDTAYALVDIVLGKQNRLSPALQEAVTDYLQHGGQVLLSGAYPASALVGKEQIQWAQDLFGYHLHAPAATHSGGVCLLTPDQTPVSPVRVLPDHVLDMTPNPYRLHTEKPDGIGATGDARIIARYADTGLGAAVATDRSVVWAFPLESLPHGDRLLRMSIQLLTH